MFDLGKKGEEKAVRFLKRKGYKILERNFKSNFGEIDIIAEKDGVVVFIEVKTRKNDNFGFGFESVNGRKIEKIIKTAQFYLTVSKKDVLSRFDVISIDSGKIEHIENAFHL